MGGTLIELILQNLMQLMPFRIVRSYEKAVRWTWGQNPKELGPGFHWCLWFIHDVEVISCAEEVRNLPTQSVVTKDGKTVIFSMNYGRKVVDAVKHFCEVQDFDASADGLAMTHMSKRVRAMDYGELVADLSALERSLENTLETRFKRWGNQVTHVGFTDFVEAGHQVRLFGDPPRL